MDGPTIVAAIAVFIAGATSIAAPIIAGRNQRRSDEARFRHERAMKDTDELRALLDDLTAAMFEHTTNLIRRERWLMQSTLNLDPPKIAPDVLPTRRTLYTLNARLVIRRGRDDSLVESLGRYLKVTDDTIAEMNALDYPEPYDYSDEQLEQRAHSYWQAYEAFVDGSKIVAASRTR